MMHRHTILLSLFISLPFYWVHAFIPPQNSKPIVNEPCDKQNYVLHDTKNEQSEKPNTNDKGGTNVREGSLMAATIETGKVPYGEKSRKYRRTVFRHQGTI